MRYNGKEIKIIKEYGNWVLVEYLEGYKEGINKQDLGLVKIREKEQGNAILKDINGNIL